GERIGDRLARVLSVRLVVALLAGEARTRAAAAETLVRERRALAGPASAPWSASRPTAAAAVPIVRVTTCAAHVVRQEVSTGTRRRFRSRLERFGELVAERDVVRQREQLGVLLGVVVANPDELVVETLQRLDHLLDPFLVL